MPDPENRATSLPENIDEYFLENTVYNIPEEFHLHDTTVQCKLPFRRKLTAKNKQIAKPQLSYTAGSPPTNA